MRGGGGKNKGSKFEREVCVALSLWLSRGEREDLFWRAAMSGGRATVALKRGAKHQAQVGDISPITALGEYFLNHFVIECKAYKNLDVFTSLVKDTGNLHKFWFILRAQARPFGKQPFLIAKQNQMPTICLISGEAMGVFGFNVDHVIAHIPAWGCYMVLFDCFLREAAIPAEDVYIKRRRVRLATGTL